MEISEAFRQQQLIAQSSWGFRITEDAVRILHEVLEQYMVMVFEGANSIAANANRLIVYHTDIQTLLHVTQR